MPKINISQRAQEYIKKKATSITIDMKMCRT